MPLSDFAVEKLGESHEAVSNAHERQLIAALTGLAGEGKGLLVIDPYAGHTIAGTFVTAVDGIAKTERVTILREKLRDEAAGLLFVAGQPERPANEGFRILKAANLQALPQLENK